MMGLYRSEATAACPPSLSLPPLQNMLDNHAGVSVGAFVGTQTVVCSSQSSAECPAALRVLSLADPNTLRANPEREAVSMVWPRLALHSLCQR